MKQCLADSCDWDVWGKGFCKRHQYLRTDKSNKRDFRAVEPRSPIQRYKVSTQAKEGLTTKKELLVSFGWTNQKDMFDHIWKTRKHVCVLSGQDLDKVSESYRHWTMAHIIPKKLYPFFKYNEENIALLHPDVHSMVDNFTNDMIDKNKNIDFGLWFSMQYEMKIKYDYFLKENMI
jgi:hypothetical protein